MAVGYSSFFADAAMNAACNNTSFALASGLFLKLHIGDPGAAGTANAATHTTRTAVSFGVASGAAVANDATITIASLSGSQDATHFTLWDNSTAGNFIWSGTITANAYIAGDTLEFAVGDLDLTMTPAS